jgi:hypothetical protein
MRYMGRPVFATTIAFVGLIVFAVACCVLAACGKASESDGSSKSAQQADVDATAPGPCGVPDAAVTFDAGDGGLMSGCQVVAAPASGCNDEEYLMACHGGSGVEPNEPDPSFECHPGGSGQPPPGRTYFICCPCH